MVPAPQPRRSQSFRSAALQLACFPPRCSVSMRQRVRKEICLHSPIVWVGNSSGWNAGSARSVATSEPFFWMMATQRGVATHNASARLALACDKHVHRVTAGHLNRCFRTKSPLRSLRRSQRAGLPDPSTRRRRECARSHKRWCSKTKWSLTSSSSCAGPGAVRAEELQSCICEI